MDTTTATYADDTTILAIHSDSKVTSQLFQKNLDIQKWLELWRSQIKSYNTNTCPVIYLNVQIPQANDVKYLGIHLDDRQLNWRKHISNKHKQLRFQLGKIY